MARIEYNIPSFPNESFVYACINPTCRTHFVLCPTPVVNQYYADLRAADFGQPMVNLVTDEDHGNRVDHDKVTKNLHCIFCNKKVGLKLITRNPDRIVTDERYLLLVNQLVVFNGREGPQPRAITELDDYDFQQADPQAQANPLQQTFGNGQ